ncbi:hypothetical protein JVU11DRAFT_7835 [Chiua virens]|nr:hypothetical protein JVU11DRAFT_7835 [Chiua virens]
METSTLILLSTLTGLLIYLVFTGIGEPIVQRHKVINVFSLWHKEPSIHGIGPTRIFVPNMLARWPWPHQINPNYTMLKKEADAWVASFQAFNPKAHDAYDHCNFSKHVLSYPGGA